MATTPADGYVVTPRRAGRPLADLWRLRAVLGAFAARELTVRYRPAALGALWAVLQPLALAAAATLLFHGILGVATPVPYAAFVLPGLAAWTFFHGAVTAAVPSLVNHAPLVRRMWFPREAIPLGVVVAGLVDLGAGLAAAAVVAAIAGHPPGPAALWAIALAVPLLALTAACALLGAATNVRWRDVKHALPVAMQALFLATPIAYPLSAVPERWRPFVLANPLTGIVEGLRGAWVEGRAPDAGATSLATLVSLALLLASWFVFQALARRFADVA